jgi:hypothetical protein
MPPPTWLATAEPTPFSTGTAVTTARQKRDVLAQCDTCKAIGTARVVDGGIRNTNLATANGRHTDCGGRLVAFDIGGAS